MTSLTVKFRIIIWTCGDKCSDKKKNTSDFSKKKNLISLNEVNKVNKKGAIASKS